MISPLRVRGRPAMRRNQRGVALIIMMLIVVLGVSWLLVSALSTWLNPAAANPSLNGKVLGEAKAALLGYVARDVLVDNNPGSLPCPEPLSSIQNPPNPSLEGIAAGNCTLPAVGRLPWRTLGIDKLIDASGQPLWYVVSPGWALPYSTAPPLNINFSSLGQLTVDGQPNAAVALIIAPGAALQAPGRTNCPAIVQTRSFSTTQAPANWYQQFLDCQNGTYPPNATTPGFATSGPADSFNDQVVEVTAADVMRVIEGPIAQRIQSDGIPQVLAAAASTMASIRVPPPSPLPPLFPLAAPWNPTSAMYPSGTPAFGGMLPVWRSREACDPATDPDPRCDRTLKSKPCTPGADPQCDLNTAVTWPIGSGSPNQSWTNNSATVQWLGYPAITIVVDANYTASGGNGKISAVDCSSSSPPNPNLLCTIAHGPLPCYWWNSPCTETRPLVVDVTAPAAHVGITFRHLNPSVLASAPYYVGGSATITPAPDGSATVVTQWQLSTGTCNVSWSWSSWSWVTSCSSTTITLPDPNLYIEDNVAFQSQLRDPPSSGPDLRWFLNNSWQNWTYYAVSQRYAPGGAGNCSGTAPPCLTLNIDGTANPNKQALLIFAGRALVNPLGNPPQSQPSSNVANYLEGQNAASASATPVGSTFEKRSAVTSSFNDRVLVISP